MLKAILISLIIGGEIVFLIVNGKRMERRHKERILEIKDKNKIFLKKLPAHQLNQMLREKVFKRNWEEIEEEINSRN